jgi:CubicO group peptidase (beta-lactamase class C family)
MNLTAPNNIGLCPERLQGLVHTLQGEVDRQRLPGAVVMVARHGQLALFESVGLLHPVARTAMPKDALFRIYSMTKPIVSVAAMMLMEEGKLLLGEPVARYLPEFAAQQVLTVMDGREELQAVRQSATVHDVLRHTAGLTYEFLGNTPLHRQYARLRLDSRERSLAEFTQQLAGLPLLFEPGTAFEYSRATDVLGRVIEVISGQSLPTFLRERIFEPLGMSDTTFEVGEKHHHRIAEPFAHDPDGGLPMRVVDVRQQARPPLGGSGLVSTAMDYAQFLQCLLNRGVLGGVRLLGSQTVDFMTADHLGHLPVFGTGSRALLPVGYGFGLGFAVRKQRGMASVPGSAGTYFWGGLAGTTFFVDPHLDMFAMLMIQAPNQREYYRMLLTNRVYAAVLESGP